VVTDVTVKAIHQATGGLVVTGEPDFAATADLVLVVVGVRPDTELAVAAGVQTGVRGALRVDRHMRTNLPDVLAAGDCVETWHRLLNRPAYLPLGTTAHKQGRVAGETAVGGDREFAGSVGTQVVKVFELAVARTGLRDQEAQAAGFDPLTVGSTQFDHKAYYPGAHQLHLRITGDRHSGQLLGAQLVGDHRAEVAKRIDIPAGALFHHMTVDGLSDLDLSYTPTIRQPLGRHPARRPGLGPADESPACLTLERTPRFTLRVWPSPSLPSPTPSASAPTPSATTNASACCPSRPGRRPATGCMTRPRSVGCG
jgi:NADPH-dependent 2,4-dienoyl-CoA reductase/sulfur reductase-like enzyme